MERIKLAIEKARQQQARQAQTGAPAVGGGRSAAQAEARPASGGADLEDLRYSRTRVARLDADHLERHRILAHDKSAPASRAFDLLRTHVLQKMEENGWRTLAITSPTPAAGKTMVAINLAMSIAHQTQKSVMLVDFDLRKPKVGAYLGLSQGPSLNEVLAGAASLPDALVNPELPRLVLLPTLQPVANPAETLASKRVANLITELRQRYDSRIVIFDLPPLLNTDDAIAVLPQIDCTLLVVGDGMSGKAEIEASLRHLPAASRLGEVLNKAQGEAMPYY